MTYTVIIKFAGQEIVTTVEANSYVEADQKALNLVSIEVLDDGEEDADSAKAA